MYSISATRCPATAAVRCPVSFPHVNRFCDTESPSTYWFAAPNPTFWKLESPLLDDWQVTACASAALRSAAVALAPICGAQSAALVVVVVSDPPRLNPENWDRRVRV